MAKAQDGGASNDQAAAKANIVRKMMPDSLVGKFYSKGPQTQKYIVIHNTAGGDADSNVSWFHSGQQPGTSIHFVCDDEKVYQLMELNWKAHHCGDKKDAAHASSPMTNSNTLGIEVADGYNPSTGKYDSSRVNLDKAAEVVIELTRYLMKELNIDADHVVRHHDVTGKQCPGGFMQDNNRLWNYIKSEIKKRNDENKPIDLNTDNISVPNTPNNPGSSTDGGPSDGSATITDNGLTTGHNDYLKYYSTHTDYSNGTNAIDILPNQDHRYNIANMDEVRGACLIFLPPYNVCPVGDRQKFFEEWGWDRKYHYVIDHSYDVDANPDDDVPEISECTAGTSTDNSGTGDEDNGTEEGGNTENGGNVEDGTENDDNTLGDDDLTTASISIKSAATFENTIFCGDSLTVGLQQNNEKLRAFATGGHAIHQGYDKHMNDIKNASNVSNVVISYGVNDAGHQQPERFKKYYIKFINAVKESHPEAKIYVNKIFPGDLSRATNDIVKICLENVPSHNAVLPEVCTTTGATLMDCTSFVNLNDYYSSDGIHFVGKFYTLWAEEMLRQISGQVSTNPNDPSNPGNNPGSGPTFNTPEVNSPEATEDNCIVIKGGLEKIDNRLLQLYGLADVDKVTYISRSLFNGHPEKHNIMIACFIPSYDDLEKDKITYEQVEKNIINSVSKILWANGLEAKDLWREFDINRMPSPAIYLDRDKWKDLLAEIDKQVEWRNQKFGKVSTTYVPYVATISTIEFGSTPGGGTTPSTPGSGTPGEMTDVGEVEKTVYATLTGLGLTPEAACAIMGNMYQESRMDNDVVNSIGASGLCQWRLDRLDGLKKYAASKGKEWTDVATQAEWCWKECLGEDSTTKSKLATELGSAEAFAKLTDIERAVVLFRKCFERCGEAEARDDVRIKAAKDYYSKVAKGGSSSGDDITTASVNLSDVVFTAKAQGTLSWPCPSCKSISSKFGPRNTGIPGASKNHKGIDIPCGSGTDIISAAAGTVVVAKDGYNGGRGVYMVVDHGNGLGTLYQHLTKCVKSVGQSVAANEVIAKSGDTGIGSGPHLHFEVHENFSGTGGTPVNPEKYVSPGTTNGSIPGSSSGSSGGGTDPGSGDSGTTNSPINISSDKLVNSPAGDIVNPGPAAQLPYSGNSMGGLNHDNWGGKMIYTAGDPTDETATKPEITSVLTSAEYKEFCDRFFMSEEFNSDGSFEVKTSFRKYWEYIDIYVADHEPYDKGLVDADLADITNNDRLNALTTNFITNNENTFHFNVVESGPGSTYHCVRAADELNVIARPNDLKVEPIYPDLIIPPHYSTTDYDESSPNTIPLSMLENTSLDEPDMNKQYAFDYNLLSGKKKETNPCSGPINFLDPYPIDDKIQELENHFPKVFIDEIESQMYSCNHPGCPIAQPMAKNFAMLQDAVMNQSKRVEQRLCKLENILSTIMRNQGRLASRININCVYYGGQSVYGKYKCIRCMHDDRIHDGAIVTLDQCLNCTRYEPVLGQVYQILDDTGLNASIILDDMQMSYSDLYAVQQLNMGILRSPKYDYVEASGDKNCLKPEKTRIDIWKEANKTAFLEKEGETSDLEYEDQKENESIQNENDGIMLLDNTNNEGVAAEQAVVNTKSTATVKETDYLFRMDWNDTFFNQQEADVKTYPAENIIARYKKTEPDVDYETYLLELDPELDKDTIEDVQKEMSLLKGQWVDTREKAETAQVNKYSSENFYFKGFAEYKVANAVNGGSSPGDNNGGGTPGGAIGAECRAKIVEMAAQIVADYDAGKAKYKTPSPRTVDYTKPQSEGGKVCYDCTSFVSCCYTHAGLKSMYDKSCSGGSLIAEIVNNGGKMWMLNDAGLQEAKPGDVVLKANSAVSESQMGTKIGTSHAMVYIGDGKISHASSPQSGIKTEDLKSSFRWKDGKHFFVRPKDLIDADAQAAQTTPGGGLDETAGTIEGKNYVAKISGAVCTSYFSGSGSASGLGLENGKTCASHNIPYGTKIYFPSLKNKLGDGIVTVTDTGGPIFDFDIYTNAGIGKINADAYVLSWGTGKIAASYTEMIDFYNDAQWNNLKAAWNKYKSMNGQLINFLKFSQKDANVKNHKRY